MSLDDAAPGTAALSAYWRVDDRCRTETRIEAGVEECFGGAQLQANLMLQLFSSIERVLPGFALMAARNYIAI